MVSFNKKKTSKTDFYFRNLSFSPFSRLFLALIWANLIPIWRVSKVNRLFSIFIRKKIYFFFRFQLEAPLSSSTAIWRWGWTRGRSSFWLFSQSFFMIFSPTSWENGSSVKNILEKLDWLKNWLLVENPHFLSNKADIQQIVGLY